MTTKELRAGGRPELRAAGDGTLRKLGGYAVVFDSPTNICGIFDEKIAPGAFTKALPRDDVRALFNHDPNFVLGRNTNKTLVMSEDKHGLQFEAEPPDTTWAKDLLASVSRGDITQCSFSFRALKEEWDETGKMPLRTVIEAELIDVSVVTYPAYPDTTVGVRSLGEWRSQRGVVVPDRTVQAAARMRMRQAQSVHRNRV